MCLWARTVDVNRAKVLERTAANILDVHTHPNGCLPLRRRQAVCWGGVCLRTHGWRERARVGGNGHDFFCVSPVAVTHSRVPGQENCCASSAVALRGAMGQPKLLRKLFSCCCGQRLRSGGEHCEGVGDGRRKKVLLFWPVGCGEAGTIHRVLVGRNRQAWQRWTT